MSIWDLEGVFISGDFAAEGLEIFMRDKIENHKNLYEVLSTVDDYWADYQAPAWKKNCEKKDYPAGTTLNLVHVPLKAWGATNEFFGSVAREVTKLYPYSIEAVNLMKEIEPNTFINTTSWDKCVKPIMDVLGIPMENVYCSVGELDRFKVDEKDVEFVKNKIEKIAALPVPRLDKTSKPINDEGWETVKVVDEFYEWVSSSSFQPFLDLKVVEKSESVRDAWKKTGMRGRETIGGGDSITDKKAMGLIRASGGSAVSYTGNRYAVYAGNMGVISYSPAILPVIVEYHLEGGLKELKMLAEKLKKKSLLEVFEKEVDGHVFDLYQTAFKCNAPIIVDLTKMNETRLEDFAKFSTAKRSDNRKSELLGRLG